MGRLTCLGAAFVLSLPAIANASPVDRWAAEIREAADRFQIPEQWISKVMSVESGGAATLNGSPITSPSGAMGLMQLMPGTWGQMREALRLGDDPYEPRDNILAGAGYLRALYDRFGYPELFAAYNAGPRRFEQSRATGGRLPRETEAYVAKVLKGASMPAARRGKPRTQSTIFALGVRRRGSPGKKEPVQGSLFAIHR